MSQYRGTVNAPALIAIASSLQRVNHAAYRLAGDGRHLASIIYSVIGGHHRGSKPDACSARSPRAGAGRKAWSMLVQPVAVWTDGLAILYYPSPMLPPLTILLRPTHAASVLR